MTSIQNSVLERLPVELLDKVLRNVDIGDIARVASLSSRMEWNTTVHARRSLDFTPYPDITTEQLTALTNKVDIAILSYVNVTGLKKISLPEVVDHLFNKHYRHPVKNRRYPITIFVGPNALSSEDRHSVQPLQDEGRLCLVEDNPCLLYFGDKTQPVGSERWDYAAFQVYRREYDSKSAARKIREDINFYAKLPSIIPPYWIAHLAKDEDLKEALVKKGAAAQFPFTEKAPDAYKVFRDYLIERDRTVTDEEFSQIISNQGDHALVLALHGKREKIAQQLVNSGADVNANDARGWTPLQIVSGYGHEEGVMQLLDFGADPNKRGFCDVPPLYHAMISGHINVLEKLSPLTSLSGKVTTLYRFYRKHTGEFRSHFLGIYTADERRLGLNNGDGAIGFGEGLIGTSPHDLRLAGRYVIKETVKSLSKGLLTVTAGLMTAYFLTQE